MKVVLPLLFTFVSGACFSEAVRDYWEQIHSPWPATIASLIFAFVAIATVLRWL